MCFYRTASPHTHLCFLGTWVGISFSQTTFPKLKLGSRRRAPMSSVSRRAGAPRGGYLIESVVVRLDAHAVQDLLDVLGAGGCITPEGGQQVGGNVAHPETRRKDRGVTQRPLTSTAALAWPRVAQPRDPYRGPLVPRPARSLEPPPGLEPSRAAPLTRRRRRRRRALTRATSAASGRERKAPARGGGVIHYPAASWTRAPGPVSAPPSDVTRRSVTASSHAATTTKAKGVWGPPSCGASVPPKLLGRRNEAGHEPEVECFSLHTMLGLHVPIMQRGSPARDASFLRKWPTQPSNY